MNDQHHFYVPITKRDDDKRMVWGYASTGDLDSDGERMDMPSLKAALPDYMQYGNVREMHQLSAVGKTVEATFDDKGLYIGAHIVDDVAWKKVKAGVYNGFSVGSRVLKKAGVLYTKRLGEISVVDRPSNPSSMFEVWKADDAKPQEMEMTKEEMEALGGIIANAVKTAVAPLEESITKLASAKPAPAPAPKKGDDDDKAEPASVLKMQAELDELKEAAEKREKADHIEKRKKVLDAACSAGKFRAEHRKQWEKDYDENPGMVERILKNAPAIVPVGDRKGFGGSGDDKSATEQFDELVEVETQKVLDHMRAVDPKNANEGDAYMQAVNKVAKAHQDLYKARTDESLRSAASTMLPFGHPGALPGE